MNPAEANLKIFLSKLLGRDDGPGGLSDAELQEWQARQTEINEWWRWFTGEALKEEDKTRPLKDGTFPLKYPLQMNPTALAARLHAYALWGEVPDTSGPLVRTIVEPRFNEAGEADDAGRKLARQAELVLEQIEYENHTRAADIDMGVSIQALGGVVLKVGWEPSNPLLPTGIRYEYFDPRYFHARWQGKNYWDLTEAWIKMPITKAQADGYGVQVTDDTVNYEEWWSRDEYWVRVDGQDAKDAEGKPIKGTHDWGFCPMLYNPHERTANFWGNSLVPSAIGQIKELNAREADVGDAISFGVHSLIWAKNIKNTPRMKTFENGQPYIDAGRATTSSDPEPDIKRLDSPKLPEGSQVFTNHLLQSIRITLMTPEIAYGLEEGSQRSGQTLYSRMWPLLAHVQSERVNWSEARSARAEMALKILALRGRAGITQAHLGLRKRQIWSPMVPVDRQQLVDELVRLLQEKGISLEMMLERLGTVPDIQAELKRIKEQAEAASNLEAASKPQPIMATPDEIKLKGGHPPNAEARE